MYNYPRFVPRAPKRDFESTNMVMESEVRGQGDGSCARNGSRRSWALFSPSKCQVSLKCALTLLGVICTVVCRGKAKEAPPENPSLYIKTFLCRRFSLVKWDLNQRSRIWRLLGLILALLTNHVIAQLIPWGCVSDSSFYIWLWNVSMGSSPVALT